MVLDQQGQLRVLTIRDINDIDDELVLREHPGRDQHPPAPLVPGSQSHFIDFNTAMSFEAPEEGFPLLRIDEEIAERDENDFLFRIPEHSGKPVIDFLDSEGAQIDEADTCLRMVEESPVFDLVPPHVGGKARDYDRDADQDVAGNGRCDKDGYDPSHEKPDHPQVGEGNNYCKERAPVR